MDRVLYVPYMCDHAHLLAAASRRFGINCQVLPHQDERTIELGRKYTSSRECFPLICTTGDFLKKIFEQGFEPDKASFFMPDHNGPCRFGQYNRLQRIIFDHLGFRDVKIISPGNDNSYEDLSRGHGIEFRIITWKGFISVDMLKKLLHQRRPYELHKGECDRTYQEYLREIQRSVENGAKDIGGEIFMRDNPYCNGFIIQKLEKLGAETLITPTREWINYSTYRYWRDSRWSRNIKGLIRS
ncbi:MAG: hypothetical protein AMS17_20885, partial [Spirochaetes bacterium DG_61]